MSKLLHGNDRPTITSSPLFIFLNTPAINGQAAQTANHTLRCGALSGSGLEGFARWHPTFLPFSTFCRAPLAPGAFKCPRLRDPWRTSRRKSPPHLPPPPTPGVPADSSLAPSPQQEDISRSDGSRRRTEAVGSAAREWSWSRLGLTPARSLCVSEQARAPLASQYC